ncbi:MAG: polysaccharide deacetylase family protein [Nitrospirota bacterium]|nr:polysaccharide deacetylase family protein [Nitrospirota bacterium]
MKKKDFCIPVLTYHHVNDSGNFISVKPYIFESHIRHLKEKGYTSLTAHEFLLICSGAVTAPEKPVMITFDDGWLDNWVFAYPILKKYEQKAVIFVVTSLVAEEGRRVRTDEGLVRPLPSHKECQKIIETGQSADIMFSWEEAREMEKSGLIDIQSHTNTHRRWDRLYPDRNERISLLHHELVTSKKIVEEKLNKECNALCWPWGRYDQDYIETALSSGYNALFTTKKGTNTRDTDLKGIRRLGIGNISTFTLRKKLFIHSRSWLSSAYLKYFD